MSGICLLITPVPVHCFSIIFIISVFPLLCVSHVIKLGYITGSKLPRPGIFYRRPGQAISGALTLALGEINNDSSLLPNHVLEFIIAETYGIESESIKQTMELITRDVSVYTGPQETCIHEAKVAAAFDIAMISYESKIKCFMLHQNLTFFST